MSESHDREIIGGHLLVIGGAEDKYNERRILKKFLELAGGDKAEVLIVPVAVTLPTSSRRLSAAVAVAELSEVLSVESSAPSLPAAFTYSIGMVAVAMVEISDEVKHSAILVQPKLMLEMRAPRA